MTHYESPVKPNSLSWRVINGSCDTDPTKKVFLMGGSLESKRQAVVLRDAFKDLSNKWAKEIEMTFAETKTHFEVAGGNYTFFFVLPALFKAFRKKHPFLRLKLDLLELRDGRDLAKKDADLVLSSRFVSDDEAVDFSAGAREGGYSVLRKNYSDWSCFAVTDQVCKKYGSKEDVLKHHDFISTRIYVTMDQDTEKRNLPEKVSKEDARYSVGLYPVGYEMMLNGLGVWRVYKHNAKRKGVSVLEEKSHEMERFLISKNFGALSARPYKKIVSAYLDTAIGSQWNEENQI